MTVAIKWFPPSWFQIKSTNAIIYLDPSYLRSYFTHYPKKIEFSKWPDPIDGLPEKLAKADIILLTHDHKDHAKEVTINRLKSKNTLAVGPECCRKNLGNDIKVIRAGEKFTFKGIKIEPVHAYNTEKGNSTRKIHHKGNGVGYV